MGTLRGISDPWEVYERETSSSSSCDAGQNACAQEELKLKHLLLLRDAFTRRTTSDRGSRRSWRGARKKRGGERGMSLEEFQNALSAVIGPDSQSGWLERVFNEIDVSCDGYVEWEDLCSYLLQQCRERDHTSRPRGALLDTEPLIKHCSHNKQEPTICVVAVPHPPPLRYISVSKGGLLTVWNNRLQVLETLELAGDPAEQGVNRRRFRGWTTDAVYLPKVHKVAIATSSRDLHFVDVSTASCFEDIHLFGFPNVPTSLCYWHDIKSPGGRSLLLWGDEKGGIHLLWFLQLHNGLFESPFTEDNVPQRIYMQDIGDHSRLVSYQHIPTVHQEPINRIIFEPHTDLIMTSSGSDASSVVIMHVSLRRKPYVWRINKGVTCFDFSRSLNLLVTGGLDPAVKLWNCFMTARPVAVLHGHGTTVLDVVIYQPLGQVLSYSKDAELRVWDISSNRCLRTVHLQFPCLQPGRAPEHGNFPFLLVAPPFLMQTPPHILVSCRDYLARLRLEEGERGEEQGEGRRGGGRQCHGAPLSCALYNPTLKQVIAGCDDSSVSVWDVETGRLRLKITSAHGEEEITCMALDSSHRRLITGARNGTIKVWNLLNGLNLHKLEPVTLSEVTGVICLHDSQLLAVGWSQQVAQYDIKGAKDVFVRADMSWKSGQQHRADILVVDHCPTLGVIATGSHDGEVIVWTLDTQRPLVRLRRATHSLTTPPVDALLFLQRRGGDKHWRSTPILLSSQAGGIYWWSITGHTHTHGQFYAPGGEKECVLGLTSDQENNILVTGDTAGCVQVWDISQYALCITQEPSSCHPPLLQSWRAHEGAIVSVEVLVYTERLFFLSGSVDGTSRVWTGEGGYVGSFGQEPQWSLTDPAPHHTSRDRVNNLAEEEKEEREEKIESESDQSQSSEVTGQTSDLFSGGQGSPEEWIYEGPVEEAPTPENQTGPVGSEESPAPSHTQNIRVSQCHQLYGGIQRKMAVRRERRQVFGDINVNKLFPIGGLCTPFQALAVQDCQHVFLPEDLPMSPWMQRQTLSCVSEDGLSSLQLSINSSEQEQEAT
ncbi:WD repeat-containing protein on Y chromosome [Salmo salar]|uniref:WD repeat-containing protein on Y chromosome n=1 Tax=Salmo salar TaxID=8030 RepID=A0ABM3FAH9_SALSA|nr:WD repeat-containing protein on Y chromosome [Salmo salar]|eukprot:XP_014065076.1 PREDICTED: WD repeat-containing protein on Y chromosome-like isoform X2 [Salmo salar]